jgi:hypothetical protein
VQKLNLASVAMIVMLVAISAARQTFKVYPGATKFTPPETKESREAAKSLPAGTEASGLRESRFAWTFENGRHCIPVRSHEVYFDRRFPGRRPR